MAIIRRRRSQHRTKNVLNNTVKLLLFLGQFGDSTPLQPLKVVCSVAINILDGVQAVERLKEDCESLANSAAELVLAVCIEYPASPDNHPGLMGKVDILLNRLREIRDFLKSLRGLKGMGFFWRMQELRDSLVDYNNKLQQCYTASAETFKRFVHQVNAGLGEIRVITQETRGEMKSTLYNINKRVDSLMQVHRDREDPFVVTAPQVVLKGSVCTGSGLVYKAELRGKDGKSMVVVKMYKNDGSPAGSSEVQNHTQVFRRDVNTWKSLFHPNVHQLMGYTSSDCNGPDPKFIVFNDYAYNNVQNFRNIQLGKGDIASVVSIAKLLQGLASGLEFLRTCGKVCKRELQDCLKTSNTVISEDGRLIVGHHLLIDKLRHEPLDNPDSEVPWMKDALWYMVTEFVYGPKNPDYTDWNCEICVGIPRNTDSGTKFAGTTAQFGGKSASHLRMLQTFIDHTQPSITHICKDLDRFVETLDDLNQDEGSLNYQTIRNAILEVKGGRVAYCYRPKTPLPVKFLDIGYMDNAGNYVLVENVRHLIKFEPYVHPGRTFNSSGGHTEGMPDGTGILRHRFFNPTCAQVRQMTSCEGIAVTKVAWDFVINELPGLYQERYKHTHPNVPLSKFFLVTRIETDLRYSYLNWVPEPGFQDGCTSPPEVIEFVEYENTSYGKPWGYWEISDKQGISIKDYRCAQNIGFIQLEGSDDTKSE
ncbi:hypothetical protein M0805_008092 [Coniferiporia weirii]|nr:hypothetical protein M0805_008092 [Coniferiporia weirii]